MCFIGGSDEQTVLEQIELYRQGMKTDLFVTSRIDIAVAVADHRNDLHHFDDDLITFKSWDPLVQPLYRRIKIRPGHLMKKVLVRGGHFPGHDGKVLPPFVCLGFLGNRRTANKDHAGKRKTRCEKVFFH